MARSSAAISRNPERRIRRIPGSPGRVRVENATGWGPRPGALRPGREVEFGRGRADVSGNRTVLQRTAGPNRRFSREPWADPDGSPENRAKNNEAIPVAWPRFSRAYTRSNNTGSSKGGGWAGKRTPWLRMARPASSMRGVWNPRPPRRSGRPNRQHRCSGNRRRRARLIGAAAAVERRALRSALRKCRERCERQGAPGSAQPPMHSCAAWCSGA